MHLISNKMDGLSNIMKVLVLLILCIPGTQGYSSGNIASACATMVPEHGTTPQTSDSPFTVTASRTTYQPGEAVTVRLATTDPSSNFRFKGFFLQARDTVTSLPIGRFSPSDDNQVKLHSCSGGIDNAVSHTSSVEKVVKHFTWTSDNGGDVVFQVTVVQQRSTFWTGVRSSVVSELTSDTPTPTSASDTTDSPTTTTATTTSNATSTTQVPPVTTPNSAPLTSARSVYLAIALTSAWTLVFV